MLSLIKIPVFAYLNGEQNKAIVRPGGDIVADVKVWRRGGKGARVAEGFALMDVQLVATSEEAGGQADSNHCSPPSNLCLGNQKHMAPYNGSSVVL